MSICNNWHRPKCNLCCNSTLFLAVKECYLTSSSFSGQGNPHTNHYNVVRSDGTWPVVVSTLSFVNVPVCGCPCLPALLLYRLVMKTELFGCSTDPVEVAVAGLLSAGNDIPSAASQLCGAMGLCLPGKGQGERAQGMAPSSSPWEQENSRPRRHIRGSQLFKRGLGSVRKWAIFLTVSKSCTWKEEGTQETETGVEEATKHRSQLCISALAQKIFLPAFLSCDRWGWRAGEWSLPPVNLVHLSQLFNFSWSKSLLPLTCVL